MYCKIFMHYQKGKLMKRLPLRTMIVLVCLGIVALISITVQQTFSKSLVTPRNSYAVQVAAGGDHTCAIQTNSLVKCWGANSSGQLGYGDMRQRGDEPGEMGANLAFVDLGSGLAAIQISLGDSHSCAILEDHTLKCWGNNQSGKLGLDDTNNRGDESGEMGNNLPIIDIGIGATALAVSAGTDHTCAILNNHTLKCWGDDSSGQLGYGNNTTLISPSANAIDLSNSHTALAVSAGIKHTCAILDDNTVHCWGDNTYGQLGMGNTTQLTAPSATAVDIGNHTAIAISAHGNHTCVVLDDFTAKCWGYNNVGQLGQGDIDNRGDADGEMGTSLPVIDLGNGRTARAIVTSNRGDLDYTCALLDDATVKCWGENGMGQLGQGDGTNRGASSQDMTNLNAIDVGTGQTVASISIGKAHTCVVLTSTNITCWGLGNSGRLGYGNNSWLGSSINEMGDTLPKVDLGEIVATATPTKTATSTNTITPTKTTTSTNTITPTKTTTLTKTATSTKTITRSLTPSRSRTPTKSRTRTATPIGGIKEVVAVSTGGEHACAILANDTVVCWGQNSYGQLGYDDSINHGSLMNHMGSNLAAVNLGLGRTAKAIATGYDHTCALLDDNTVKCWGSNDAGQLGYGDITTRGTTDGDMAALAAIDLGTGRTAIAIAAGSTYTCAILDNKRVKCWGYNSTGELGLGDVSDHGTQPDQMGDYLPYVDLGSGHTAKLIRTGSAHTCVLLDDDTVKCWGYNGDGNLGLGDSNNRGDIPEEMGDNLPNLDFGTRRVQTIAVGADSACALFDSGAVTCWGYNTTGVLGQGHMNNRGDTENQMGAALLNIDLGSGHTAKAIAINYHACAILDDDTVKCWGGNSMGQLGYGDTSDRGDEGDEMGDSLPTINLGDNLTAKSVSVGNAFTCAIINTNKLKCWGDNTYGQLGYNDIYMRGNSTDYMGDYLPAVAFGVVQTSTPTLTYTKTNTSTKTATSTKSNTPTKTATRTKSNTLTKTATRTNTLTKTATSTKTSTLTKTNTLTKTPTNTKTSTKTATSTGTATSTP